jgi:hypothetical protein
MKTSEKRGVFDSLFRTGSHGCSGDCHCGVTHYDNGNYWDDDHLENTLPQAELAEKAHPKLYQFQPNAIEYVDFNGFLYVFGCKCKMDDFIFGFLSEEKEKVINFYKHTKDRVSVDEITD